MAGPVEVIAIEWTLIAIATCVVGARLYLRIHRQRQRLMVSDILMVLAWCAAVATASCDIQLAKYGALDPGVKSTLEGFKGTDEEMARTLKLFWLSTYPFLLTLWLSKAALLSMFLQIFPKFMKKRRALLWTVITYSIMAFIATICTYLFICLPPYKNWTLIEEESCDGSPDLIAFQVAWILHFIGDVLIFALPWFIITGLNMKLSLKVGVYCTFLLGLINIIVCIARYLVLMLPGLQSAGSSGASVVLWTAADCYIGLIVACLPSLRPFFSKRDDSNYISESSGKRGTGTGGIKSAQVSSRSRAHGQSHVRSQSIENLRYGRLDDDQWDDGSRSHTSDVELVRIVTPEAVKDKR